MHCVSYDSIFRSLLGCRFRSDSTFFPCDPFGYRSHLHSLTRQLYTAGRYVGPVSHCSPRKEA